jgi:alpha-tubulin suppressor-like RCC1 family protein
MPALVLLGLLPLAGLRAQTSPYTRIGSGENHSVALRTDGTLWAWGSNAFSQFGNGNTTGRTLPAQVLAPVAALPGTTWTDVATGVNHLLARRSDGTLWGWGFNANGNLGDGTTTTRVSPVLIPAPVGAAAGTTWGQVATNSFTLALRSDGTLWSWGDNQFGQLGSGGTTARSSAGLVAAPAGAPATSTWTAVALGASHALALRSDGTLWAWGYNTYGQLGDNSSTNRLLPTQVNTPTAAAAGTTWTGIAAGEYFSLGLRSDGTLWAWGYNFYGQLGDASTTSRQVPVAVVTPAPVGAGTTWTRVAAGQGHSAALRSDGSLWAWGKNDIGQLGNNTIIDQLTATRETTNSLWSQLAANRYNTLAVRAGTGLIFGTGFNGSGQLGNGTTTNTRVFAASAAPVTATRQGAAPLTGVYPNPAQFRCQLPALPPGAELTLSDLQGRLVQRTPAAPTLSLRGLAPGLYLLTAQAPGLAPRTVRLAVE